MIIWNIIFSFCSFNSLWNAFRDTIVNDSSNVIEVEKSGEEWHSLSCMSDSTDQSVPVNFDMYNRVIIIISKI